MRTSRRLLRAGLTGLVLLSLFVAVPSVATATDTGVGHATAIPYLGFDVSWPNCAQRLPGGRDFAVVGVTGGRAFTTNPCLASQFPVAKRTGLAELYMNIGILAGASAGMGRTGPRGICSTTQLWCRSYNYGYNAARAAWSYAVSRLGSGAYAPRWWLDVELNGNWSTRSTSVNAAAIAGALRFLSGKVRVGVYSTSYQWRTIAGSYRPRVAVWYATVHTTASLALHHCAASYGFTGGPVKIVQYTWGSVDADVLC